MIAFFKDALPASYSGSLGVAGYPAGTVTYHEPGDTPLGRLQAFLTADLTGGTVVVAAEKDGGVLASVTLSVGVPMAAAPIVGGLRAGDRLQVLVVSSADLAPTTADLLAVVA